jgi:uncharacterized membrane protein YgcG
MADLFSLLFWLLRSAQAGSPPATPQMTSGSPSQLRIQTPPAAAAGKGTPRVSSETSLLKHLVHGGILRLLLQLAPTTLLLGLVYGVHAVLSSGRGSYLFTLLLLLICVVSFIGLRGDKLSVPMLACTVLLSTVLLGYHVGLLSGKIFLLLAGVVGVFFALLVAILSVYSGTAVSKRAQELLFLMSLVLAPLGALAQLFLAPGPQTIDVATTVPAVDAAGAVRLSELLQPSSASLSPYLLGLLLSLSLSLFNLFSNKRSGNSHTSGSTGGMRSRGSFIGGGGFIPGRDDAPASFLSDQQPRDLDIDLPVDSSPPAMETPQLISPGQQYRQRMKKAAGGTQ